MLGLEAYEGCPREALRGATRRALENLVRLAIDEKAALLLVAGDLYDGAWKDHQTGLYFASQMRKLREAGIRVVLLRGNHDAESEITQRVHLPENVRELRTDSAETVIFEELGVAIHGRGFPTRDVREDLARSYPEPVRGLFNIGMLHTALHGRPGHEPYAPTTLEVLIERGYDYWALGHVHQTEVVHTDPYIVFPGNLQGRHIKETGPKGAFLLSVDQCRVLRAEHRPLDHARYWDCRLVAAEQDSWDDIVIKFRDALLNGLSTAQGRLLAARVTVVGRPVSHGRILREKDAFIADIRAMGLDVAGEGAWLGDVRVETRAPLDLVALSRANDPLAHLLRAIDKAALDPVILSELRAQLADFAAKLPKGLRELEEFAFFDDGNALVPVLDDVKELLVSRLVLGVEEPH